MCQPLEDKKSNCYRETIVLIIKRYKSDMAKMNKVIEDLLQENIRLEERIEELLQDKRRSDQTATGRKMT